MVCQGAECGPQEPAPPSLLTRLLLAHTLVVGTSLHATQATNHLTVAPASRAWLAGNTHIQGSHTWS